MRYLFTFVLFLLYCLAALAAAEPDLQQDTLGYCNARAGLSLRILNAMEDGTRIDQINIGFEQPPESLEMERAREDWVAQLKVEITAAIATIPREKDDWAQRVAQKIIEKCWYDYGKRRVEKQSALPGLRRCASSEALPQSTRFNQCSEQLADQVLIGNMIGGGGGTAGDLRTMAARSEQQLGPERFRKVLALIDEAEKSQAKEGGVQAWFDNYWHACMDGAN